MTEPVTAADVIARAFAEALHEDDGELCDNCITEAAIPIRALREVCGGGDIVIRADGTLATLEPCQRAVTGCWRIVPVERGA